MIKITAPKAIEICDHPKTQWIDLFRIITSDPYFCCLTQKLYRQFYPQEQKDYICIERIIITLNLNTVKNIILKAAEYAMLEDRKKGDRTGAQVSPTPHDASATLPASSSVAPSNVGQSDDIEKLWRHSLATAACSRLLAQERGIPIDHLQEYYCTGLVCNIHNFFAERDEARYQRAALQPYNPRTLNREWLPLSFCDVMEHHHDPEQYKGKYADLVHHIAAAQFFVNQSQFSINKTDEKKIGDKILKKLNISDAVFSKFEKTMVTQVQAIEQFARSKTEEK